MLPSGHVFIAMSLDGFIARQDHRLDWLMKQETAGEDHGFDAFVDSVDGIVMGSSTFKTVLEFDSWHYTKPVCVMSSTLTDADIPAHLKDKAFVSDLAPDALMEMLGTRGWARAYVDGGLVIQPFLRAGLIADMQVTLIPILLGNGLRLFGELDADIDLGLKSVEGFPSGLVTTRYQIL